MALISLIFVAQHTVSASRYGKKVAIFLVRDDHIPVDIFLKDYHFPVAGLWENEQGKNSYWVQILWQGEADKP